MERVAEAKSKKGKKVTCEHSVTLGNAREIELWGLLVKRLGGVN